MRGSIVTAERLRELLGCDPETGLLIWKMNRQGPGARAGEVAGCKDPQGYIKIGIDGRMYLAHRLIWLHIYGAWPDGELDHINHDPSDNRIENLRLATNSQNMANRPAQINNTSGFKGTTFHKQRRKWQAQITVNKKVLHLGLFKTPEAAHAAYVLATQALHGEFARAA
jgi:HNH endonuclease/AP2 domain